MLVGHFEDSYEFIGFNSVREAIAFLLSIGQKFVLSEDGGEDAWVPLLDAKIGEDCKRICTKPSLDFGDCVEHWQFRVVDVVPGHWS